MNGELEEVFEFYHYGLFVPMEHLRFNLGYLFYPVIEYLVNLIVVVVVVVGGGRYIKPAIQEESREGGGEGCY
jgi:hypothetical protein